ncbi:MAG: type II secretion system protein GspD [Candidatus Omnitrophica bacterium]|nr:type II secretion system protein GspD [Candidatus Omnitrophota bacterium]
MTGSDAILALLVIAGTLGASSAGMAQPLPPPPAPAQVISLDLRGVDILDVLKMLSQQSGLNFVAGRNVSGRVTVFVKDVEVWEAFERIVDANELAYERRGGIVHVMTARDYELLYGDKFQARTHSRTLTPASAKAVQLAAFLNQVKSAIGRVAVDEASNTLVVTDSPSRLEEMQRLVEQVDRPLDTRVYELRYAEAEKLKERLEGWLTPGLGTVQVDARTNTLMMTDLPEVTAQADRLVQAFDVQDREVLIEAKIMKVELSDEQSLGIDWQQTFSGVRTQGRTNFRVLADIVGGAGTGAALKYLSAGGETAVVIEALKQFGKVETLSNPRIMVLNGQEAKILVGTKEAFVTVTTTVPTTGSVVTSPQIQFVDVGTKLFVTPRIKPDGHVQLSIKPEVSTAKVETFQSNRIPIVSTTEAQTVVLIKSGATLIIGGLIDTKAGRTRSQIPVVGDLPLIGAAFRSQVDTTRKTELVVFLTPQIVSTTGEPLTTFQGNGTAPVPVGYQALVRALLSSRLTQLLGQASPGAGEVRLAFGLDRRGRLVGTPDVASPQGEPFVQAGREALGALEPFPPFPEGTAAPQIRLQLTVEYHPQK